MTAIAYLSHDLSDEAVQAACERIAREARRNVNLSGVVIHIERDDHTWVDGLDEYEGAKLLASIDDAVYCHENR